MRIIPVLDLMNGQVVQAVRGERDTYQPIKSILTPETNPLAVAQALQAETGCREFYIADLDAICGEGNHIELIADLHREHPELRLWVDNGLTELSRLSRLARPVIGSESLDDLSTLYQLRKTLRSPLLSLDFRAATPLGPAELEGQSAVWPEEVIVMSLSRVGSSAGPDFKLLHRLRNLAPENKIYAAGGVRDHTDLERLNEMGINGALLSTALHQGRVDPSAGADRRYK
mgnify:CR=1 FL=1